jgi:hypothetical protein
VLRGVETAAWSAREGLAAAHAIADDLQHQVPPVVRRLPIDVAEPVKYVTPSAIAVPGRRPGPLQMMYRMARSASGRVTLAADGTVFWRSPVFTAHPERRLRLTRNLPDLHRVGRLSVGFEEIGG